MYTNDAHSPKLIMLSQKIKEISINAGNPILDIMSRLNNEEIWEKVISSGEI